MAQGVGEKLEPRVAVAGGTPETFAGVFTPNILTILEIILFMRLGYVVGNVGLARALVLIGLANGISVLFREAGIICAFPQRNVHHDAQRSLEMRFIDSAHRQNSKED